MVRIRSDHRDGPLPERERVELNSRCAGELADFLAEQLPALGSQWWSTHVEEHLSYSQQQRVQETPGSELPGLCWDEDGVGIASRPSAKRSVRR